MMELDPSIRKLSAAGGVLYIILIACGIFAEIFVISKLVVSNNPEQTTTNVLGNEFLFRSGVVSHIVTLVCSLLLLGIFSKLFWCTSAYLTITLVAFNAVAVTVEAISILSELEYLALVKSATLVSVQSRQETNALAYISLRMQSTGYDIALLFFGVVCISIGILIQRSKLFAGWIGVLMIIAGVCYISNSLMAMVVPHIRHYFLPFILIPCLIAELSLAVAMIKGPRSARA